MDSVLIVDDEASMLRTMTRMLGDHYEVLAAATPAEALDCVQQQEPGLAIVDVRMPEMNGYELTARLKEVRPELAVIFMTGAVHELDAQLIRDIRHKAFHFLLKPFDREVLLTLVEGCLEVRALQIQNRVYVARLEAELAEARRFQRSLLPAERVELESVAVHGHYSPCEALGGDFFDYTRASGGCAFLVADVSGHGVSAAMWTGLVKSAFRAARRDGFDPHAVVRRVSDGVRYFDESRMLTLFCGRTVGAGRELLYVNAGHPPPILCHADGSFDLLERTGMLVTPAYPDMEWGAERIALVPGDRLLVYTDGVTEARGTGGEFFGEQRLAELASGAPPGDGLLDAVRAAVKEHVGQGALDDDLSLVTLAFR